MATLSVRPTAIVQRSIDSLLDVYNVGSFVVTFDAAGQSVAVHHTDNPTNALFSSAPGVPLVTAASGQDDFGEGYGTFKITDHDTNRTDVCALDELVSVADAKGRPQTVELRGRLSRSKDATDAKTPFVLAFSTISSTQHQLAFNLRIVAGTTETTEFRKLFLNLQSDRDESIVGLGEQLSFVNLKGQSVPIMVREDGIGRGLQPISASINIFFSSYASGDRTSAYKPVPFFFTNRMRGMVLENYDYSLFDFGKMDRIVIKVESVSVRGRLVYGSTPKDVLREYTSYAGRMQPLPDWVLDGVIEGIQGGEDKVESIVRESFDRGVPLVGVWLQDWCGKREQTVLGRTLKRLWWNWESDDALYPNWNMFVGRMRKDYRVEVLSYVNSFLADVQHANKPSFRRNMYKEAADRNYLVRNASGDAPLSISSGPNFRAGLIDLFNPDAFEWTKRILVDAFSTGAKGYMADFGEFLPPGMTTMRGVATSADHNEYAEAWSRVQAAAIAELKEKDVLVFHRSGFTKSPGITNSFWTGDQLVSWDEYDGIKSGLIGLLSGGLSGFSINHTDMGGYSTFAFNIFGYKIGYYRTQELLLRWMEFCAFQPIFRSHEGSMPDVNAQFYDNDVTFKHLALCGNIYRSLKLYKKDLMTEASQTGVPLVRHMLLEFPEDPVAWNLTHQFMLGHAILVRPVLDPASSSTMVYLPAGAWVHVWTKTIYGNVSQGVWISVESPLGRPPVFVRFKYLPDANLKPFLALMDSIVDGLKKQK